MLTRRPALKTGWMDAVLRTRRYHEDEEAAHREAIRLLRFVGLAGSGDQIARNLPYGAQRRLEIARGMLHTPEVLFLEEPTIGLDTQTRRHIWAYLRNLRESAGYWVPDAILDEPDDSRQEVPLV